MVNRDNYWLVRSYLAYQTEVIQLDPESVKRTYQWLKHLLCWADEQPLTEAARIRPVFPQYLLTTQTRSTGAKLSKAGVTKGCEYARSFFKWARENEPVRFAAISAGYIDTIRPPRMDGELPKKREFMTLDYVRCLLAVPQNDLATRRDKAALALLFLSGMRATAFCSLTLQCVNVDKRVIEQLPTKGVKTKFRKAAETTLLDIPDLMATIAEWDRERRANNSPSSLWYPPFGIGSLNEFRKHRRDVLSENLERLAKLAGQPFLSPHKARHGHAVWALQHAKSMADYKAISMNLMHDDIGTTDKIYAVLSRDDMKERISNLKEGAEGNPSALDEIVALVLARMQPSVGQNGQGGFALARGEGLVTSSDKQSVGVVGAKREG